MTKEEKKEYMDILKKLEPLLDKIAERSGQSWWSPPGKDWHFSCDMGYVEEFFDQLEDFLTDEVSDDDKKPNSRLMFPPPPMIKKEEIICF